MKSYLLILLQQKSYSMVSPFTNTVTILCLIFQHDYFLFSLHCSKACYFFVFQAFFVFFSTVLMNFFRNCGYLIPAIHSKKKVAEKFSRGHERKRNRKRKKWLSFYSTWLSFYSTFSWNIKVNENFLFTVLWQMFSNNVKFFFFPRKPNSTKLTSEEPCQS